MTKQQLRYCVNRASGLKPRDAGINAGYAHAGIAVTVSRMESREDVRKEIARLKKGGRESKATSAPVGRPIKVTIPQMAITQSDDNDPLEVWKLKDHYNSPLDLMKDVMNNKLAPKGLRIQCAKDSLMYCHARKEGGKKEEKENEAKKASTSKFGTGARPSNVSQLRAA